MFTANLTMTGFDVRRWQPADTPDLIALFRDTINTVNAADYTAAQRAAWAPNMIDPARWQKRMEANYTVVAVDGAGPVGFAELTGKIHVEMMYVAVRMQRCGIGKTLLETVEREARLQGAQHLTSHVSKTARPLFEACGFTVVKPREVELRGQRFQNFLMVKQLIAAGRPLKL